MELKVNVNDLPLEALILIAASKRDVSVTLSNETCLTVNDKVQFKSNISAMRYLANTDNSIKWMGNNALERCETNHWITYAVGPLSSKECFEEALNYLDKVIAPVTYLVGSRCSLADVVIWCKLFNTRKWIDTLLSEESPTNITRWYSFIGSLDYVKNAVTQMGTLNTEGAPTNLARWYSHIANLPFVKEALTQISTLTNNFPVQNDKNKDNAVAPLDSTGRKEEGKFVDLPGAEMGKVVVRFPPEASGYLHIGHAKAALLNQYYKDAFNGQLIMRFDDTNPAKEKEDYEKVILEDLKLLNIKYDKLTRTSNYFDIMLDMCEKLIRENKAYVDDTNAEEMKQEREKKICSKNRDNSVEKNLAMWEEMKKGTEKGQLCCVRAKIDMSSLNGCMRDPTIYRCKNELHPQTGDKYKVYPTYDFACPIVDSLEGVTHCLRTMEYHDRDDQFYWFIEALNLRKPYIWEYSRLNMTNTVLSKRKLTWFVDNGYVNGWDDPRMPTVRGVLRRGMTVEGLKQFIIAQGSSRSVVLMEWDKIWAINKKVIDPVVPRYTAVEALKNVPVIVLNLNETSMKVPKHPKNNDVGEKTMWIAPKLLVDEADAIEFKEGENVTFINWGNVTIKEIKKNADNKIIQVIAVPNIEDKNYKKTLKITWLAETKRAPLIPVICLYFDHIISKAILGKDEDFKNYINHQTMFKVQMIGEPELASIKKSEIIQLQRKGYFICDQAYESRSIHSFTVNPVVLIYIPEGTSKGLPATVLATAQTNRSEDIKNVDSSELVKQMKEQEKLVTDLRQNREDEAKISVELNKLMLLQDKYETILMQQCKPKDEVVDEKKVNVQDISENITIVGDQIRKLKSEKVDKNIIQEKVQILLELKASYKAATGEEWKPPGSSPTSGGAVVEKGSKDSSQKTAENENKGKKSKSEKVTEKKAPQKSVSAAKSKSNESVEKEENTAEINEILLKIKDVGDKIRKLKAEKSDKKIITEEVGVLLTLKGKYKEITGKDWTPNLNVTMKVDESSKVPESGKTKDAISSSGSPSGGEIKKVTEEDVQHLLDVFGSYNMKGFTPKYEGLIQESPYFIPPDASKTKEIEIPKEEEKKSPSKKIKTNTTDVNLLTEKIKEQGNLVRKMKSNSTEKEQVNKEIQQLLFLKSEYKSLTGQDFPSEGKSQSPNKKSKSNDGTGDKKQTQQKEKVSKAESKPSQGDTGLKKITRLGLEAKKEENLPDWYSQIIVKSELIEYYDISGCYILRPWSFAIWETIKDWFDGKIKSLGVKNCYFPIFVSKSVLEKEKTHIADFAPEVAWVTKSGESDLAEPIAIRPTSETVMYPSYAKWIQSYRDLPIKLNQWNNVIRWEFKHPQPFLRTREFLWQEGHTAYATYKEAEEEVYTILDLYAAIYTDLLAIPVVKGRKTEKEKFAGGDYTLTVEAYISASGRAIQGATSHHLGQNFSKMFEIIFEDPDTQEKKYVYQNSWGITTRTIGVLIMVHADNQGLVLPPNVATVQVIIVPCGITATLAESEKNKLLDTCNRVNLLLQSHKTRSDVDLRDNYSPGWKFNHWELKGVPIRVEIGPKDLQKQQIVAVRRDTGDKTIIPLDGVERKIKTLLENIQSNLLSKATEELKQHMIICKQWNVFCQELDNRNILLSPFCGNTECEDKIKEESARNDAEVDTKAPSMGAKSLCIPFEQPGQITDQDKCIHPACNAKPKFYCLFGRSY